jgi:hypothetical protein
VRLIPAGKDAPEELIANMPPRAMPTGNVLARSNVAPLWAMRAGTTTDQFGAAGGGGEGAGAGGDGEGVGAGAGGADGGGLAGGGGAGEGEGAWTIGATTSSEPPQPVVRAKTAAAPEVRSLLRLKLPAAWPSVASFGMRLLNYCPLEAVTTPRDAAKVASLP